MREQPPQQSLPADPLGSANAILLAEARRHTWSGVGALSIKTFRVDDDVYLVLNQGQTYTIAVASDTPVESCCIFFADGLATQVRHSLYSCSGARLASRQANTGGCISDCENRESKIED